MGQEQSTVEVDYETEPHFVNANGKRIVCHYWTPVSSCENPRGLVFIAHGAREHCHWYDNIAVPLTELNLAVFSHDHVGHGKSEGDRCHVESLTEYTQDVLQHIQIMKDKYGDLPIFIVGFSMGGLIAVQTAIENLDLFTGVVLVAPAVWPTPSLLNPTKVKLIRLAAHMSPQFQVGRFGADATTWGSRDPAIVKRLMESPLVWQGRAKAQWLSCLIDGMLGIQKNVEKITFPFFILHGDEDKICTLSGSQLLYEKATSKDKHIKVYKGGYHQLQNEPEGMGEEVVGDIRDWIDERLVNKDPGRVG